MTELTPLAPSYAVARARFLEAAHAAGAMVTSHRHPSPGREGEELAADVAVMGPDAARATVLVVSGTHGVEGYAGSALQHHWLSHHVDQRPDDVQVVLLHALNPYGCSWVRRVNEDNVDLNRNFVDWDAPLPQNAGYEQIAELLVPSSWAADEQERTTGLLLEHAMAVGMDRLQQDVSGGQYTRPTGLFYGGTRPTWSHRLLRTVCEHVLAATPHLAIIDLHTGLGPWGHGELISSWSTGDPRHRRAVDWWGEVTSIVEGDSVSAALSGEWLARVGEWLPGTELTAAALEFGTVDMITVLQALRADAWLHAHGDPTGPDAAPIRTQVRAAFADDDPAWLAALWPRFAEVMAAALGSV